MVSGGEPSMSGRMDHVLFDGESLPWIVDCKHKVLKKHGNAKKNNLKIWHHLHESVVYDKNRRSTAIFGFQSQSESGRKG